MERKIFHFDETHGGVDILRKVSETLECYPLDEFTFASIYSCGAEVVLNTISHGYPETFKRKGNNICSIMINESEDCFEIEFLDYGATIPVTVLNKLPDLGLTQQDDSILNMAVEGQLGLSQHRGQGLPSLLTSLDNKNIVNFKIQTGFAFLEATSEGVVFFENKKSFLQGTNISFIVKFTEPKYISKSTTISVINTIGKYPFGRKKHDGNASAEEFRDDYLIPALNNYDIVNIELDGVMGYASSFLEEVFGGLLRKGFNNNELLARLNLISEKKFIIAQIQKYIKGG
ncbi:MAG: STAS-like domain-containing protein [Acinetobacter sp.]|uniref:STAS-like domain-containing protein n=1 Tax=Citrobacter braakii TaxID=57706 RepID=UPI003AA496A8